MRMTRPNRPARSVTAMEPGAGRPETTSGATAEFFEALARRGHEPLLEKTRGTLLFDLTDGERAERWLVTIARGDVEISRDAGDADSIVRAPRELFDRVVRGEVNAMAALVRGAFVVEGDPTLVVRFQRLFPGPPPGDDAGRGRPRRRTAR
jgi:putative sterol carrier protein